MYRHRFTILTIDVIQVLEATPKYSTKYDTYKHKRLQHSIYINEHISITFQLIQYSVRRNTGLFVIPSILMQTSMFLFLIITCQNKLVSTMQFGAM